MSPRATPGRKASGGDEASFGRDLEDRPHNYHLRTTTRYQRQAAPRNDFRVGAAVRVNEGAPQWFERPRLVKARKREFLSDKTLIVFLHGIGASGAQLMPLASSWRASLPDTRFVAPDAPMYHRYGHQWFSTEGNPLDPARMLAARQAFDELITDAVRREGFADARDRVALVGVSQGAIMALDAVASGRWKVGALVAFSGLLPPQPVSPASKGTPILLVHGENDTTIPPMASRLAAAQLGTAGFNVELDVERGTGHTISSAGAQKALSFLKKTLL